MYDNISAEQWIYGLLACLIAFGVMAWLFFHYTRPRDMSTSDDAPASAAGAQPVHVPVDATDTQHAPPHGGEVVQADTTAAEAGFLMPRTSRHNSDHERIVYLAAQLKPDGKYRFSANEICILMKGNPRADVLAIVRQVREPAPEFRPLTDEQRQLRQQLQLDKP